MVTDAGRTDATAPAWTRLRRRADFQRVARGRRANAESFALQARARADAEIGEASPRVGFTVTRKIGGAVERNRIRRRLKAALRRRKRNCARRPTAITCWWRAARR